MRASALVLVVLLAGCQSAPVDPYPRNARVIVMHGAPPAVCLFADESAAMTCAPFALLAPLRPCTETASSLFCPQMAPARAVKPDLGA